MARGKEEQEIVKSFTNYLLDTGIVVIENGRIIIDPMALAAELELFSGKTKEDAMEFMAKLQERLEQSNSKKSTLLRH
jgi:hypothetical protein